MNRSRIIFLATLVCLLVLAALAHADKMIVGILEFEEKTSIGQENAGVVIPEILVSHLKQIGTYKLAERVFLKKALEEQELQASGIIDEQTAAKVGQFFGLNAIITGSAMKVEEKITISGRVIDTQSAEIIASGTVQFTRLKNMEEKLEELAYLLSGYSEKEFLRARLIKEMSKNNLAIRLGIGLNVVPDSRVKLFGSELVYQGRYIEAEFISTPMLMVGETIADPKLSGMAFAALLTACPFLHFGFGAGYVFGKTPEVGDRIISEKYYGNADFQGVCVGFTYRLNQNLRTGIYLPLITWGNGTYEVRYGSNPMETYEVISSLLNFDNPGAMVVGVEYCPIPNLTTKLSIVGLGGRGQKIAPTPDPSAVFGPPGLVVFSLSVGYRFRF